MNNLAWRQPEMKPDSTRRLVARYLFWILLPAAISLVLSVFLFDAPLVVQLALWFLTAILLFHALFALCNRVEKRHLLLVDYFYLGATALGLAMATIHYSDQRDDYNRRLNELNYKRLEQQFRGDLRPVVDTYHSATCNKDEVPLLGEHCKLAKRIYIFVDGVFSLKDEHEQIAEIDRIISTVQELEKLRIEEIYELRKQKYKALTIGGNEMASIGQIEDKMDKLSRATDVGTFQPVVASYRKLAQHLRVKVDRQRDAVESRGSIALLVVFGVGYMSVWPFFLATALALRLTRVTVEIAGWMADNVVERNGPARVGVSG